LLADVDPISRCTSTQELAALLQGLSSLGYKPDDAFVSSVLHRLQSSQQQQRAQQQQPLTAQPPRSSSSSNQAQQQGYSSLTKAATGARQAPQQQQAAGLSAGYNNDKDVAGDERGESEEEEEAMAEAQHVAAAIQALQRMGHTQQAAQLQATYLRDLQSRAAQRLQRQQAARVAAAAAAEKEKEKARLQRLEEEQQQQEARRAAVAAQAEQQRRLQQQEERERQQAAAALEAQRKQKEEEEEKARQQYDAEMRAAVRDAIARATSWQQLQSLLASVPGYLGASELCAVVVRLRDLVAGISGRGGGLTWRVRAQLSDVLQAWSALLEARLTAGGDDGEGAAGQGCCPPSDSLAALSALLELGWMNESTLGLLLREARRQLAGFGDQELAQLLQLLAAARLRPSQGWLQDYVAESTQRLQGVRVCVCCRQVKGNSACQGHLDECALHQAKQ
jgi:hypothetical protein